MSSLQIQDTDRAVLVDWKTYRTIENCTRLVVGNDEDEFIRNNQGHELIDCRTSYYRYGQQGLAIPFDEMASERSFRKYTCAFVQLASAIAYTLEDEGKIPLVYCKNGRSRSPCVLAAFFILYRGFTVNEIEIWFKESYHVQRPVTATASTNFPNFDKFKNILIFLEECRVNPEEENRGFNLAGELLIFDSLFQLSLSFLTL